MPVYIVVQCATTIIRVTLTITTRIMPRTTATMMTRGTEAFSFTLFSDAETITFKNAIIIFFLEQENRIKSFV